MKVVPAYRSAIVMFFTTYRLLPAHHYLLPARSPRQHAVSARRDQHRKECLPEHVKCLVRLIDSVRIMVRARAKARFRAKVRVWCGYGLRLGLGFA